MNDLIRRGIVPSSSLLCSRGYAKEETINIFLGCDFFGGIWNLVCRWVGIIFVNLVNIGEQTL